MRKFLSSPTMLFVAFVTIFISASTFIAVQKTSYIRKEANITCQKAPVKAGEMLWDQVSRHFVTLISIR